MRPRSTVVLRSADIAVAVDVARGAKITSLSDLSRGREWLLQPPAAAVDQTHYGARFTDTAVYGWDEMFPTIDPCRYVGEDVTLPDHGEVWSKPWDILDVSPSSLTCATDGVALQYRLTRTIDVTDRHVTLRYRLSTKRPQGMAALWAAHPQFAVLPGTILALPTNLTDLTAHREDDPSRADNVELRESGLDWRTVAASGTGTMLYANPATPAAHATLTDPDGSWLRMEWDATKIRYFALWVDNRRYAADPVVCLEPMTGGFDSLERAQQRGGVLQVNAGSPVQWQCAVSLGWSDVT
jgi:galactose mutarotase-like enzyme